MAAIWMTQRERGNPAVMRLFAWIALTLGRPFARLLLHPIVLYFVFAGGAARAASRDYMRRALGREPTPLDGYRHVHCFASALLDRMFLLNDRDDLFDIRIVGEGVMKRVMADSAVTPGRPPRGAFVIGAHLGSFEATRVGGRGEGELRLSMVMYEENARQFKRIATAINPRLADSIIALGRVDSMLRVKHALDDGRLVGMLADRTLAEEAGSAAVREARLFGDPVWISTGPFRMAAMLRRPAIFVVGLYRGGNRYELHYEDLYDFSALAEVPSAERPAAAAAAVDRAIERYVARLEHFCREAPYNWFNFYDYWNDGAHPGTHQAERRDERARGVR